MASQGTRHKASAAKGYMQDKVMMAETSPALRDISGLEMIHSAAANKANFDQEYLGLIVP